MGEIARRALRGAVEVTWDAIEAALTPLVETDEGAQEVASAFYDVVWAPVGSGYADYYEAHGKPGSFVASWRGAGGMVAELRGRGETYMDWCYDAVSGEVSPRVLRVMASLGLEPFR